MIFAWLQPQNTDQMPMSTVIMTTTFTLAMLEDFQWMVGYAIPETHYVWADVGNICHHNDVRLHFPICSNFFRHFHYFSPWFCHQRASHSFDLSFTLTTALHLRASARKNMISWLMARFNVTQSYLIVLCLRSRSSSFPRWVLGLTSPKWKHLSLTYS